MLYYVKDGNKLKELRISKKLRVVDITSHCNTGLTMKTYSRLESGAITLLFDKRDVVGIATILGVDVEDLFGKATKEDIDTRQFKFKEDTKKEFLELLNNTIRKDKRYSERIGHICNKLELTKIYFRDIRLGTAKVILGQYLKNISNYFKIANIFVYFDELDYEEYQRRIIKEEYQTEEYKQFSLSRDSLPVKKSRINPNRIFIIDKDKLREYRYKKGFTLKDIYSCSGIKANTFGLYETGHIRSMPFSAASKISEVLEFDMDEVFGTEITDWNPIKGSDIIKSTDKSHVYLCKDPKLFESLRVTIDKPKIYTEMLIGLSKKSLSNLMNGVETLFTLEQVIKTCLLFNVNRHKLFTYVGDGIEPEDYLFPEINDTSEELYVRDEKDDSDRMLLDSIMKKLNVMDKTIANIKITQNVDSITKLPGMSELETKEFIEFLQSWVDEGLVEETDDILPWIIQETSEFISDRKLERDSKKIDNLLVEFIDIQKGMSVQKRYRLIQSIMEDGYKSLDSDDIQEIEALLGIDLNTYVKMNIKNQ